MTFEIVKTSPIEGQKPGTSGLRKKTAIFREPGYLENFVQCIFDGTGGAARPSTPVRIPPERWRRPPIGREHREAEFPSLSSFAAEARP